MRMGAWVAMMNCEPLSAGLEERQEQLAVGLREGVLAVTLRQRACLRAGHADGAVLPPTRWQLLREALGELAVFPGVALHRLQEAHHVVRTEEEATPSLAPAHPTGAPCEAKRLGGGAGGRHQRMFGHRALRDGGQLEAGCDDLQEGGLAAAVVADEKRHRHREVERLKAREDGQRQGELGARGSERERLQERHRGGGRRRRQTSRHWRPVAQPKGYTTASMR